MREFNILPCEEHVACRNKLLSDLFRMFSIAIWLWRFSSLVSIACCLRLTHCPFRFRYIQQITTANLKCHCMKVIGCVPELKNRSWFTLHSVFRLTPDHRFMWLAYVCNCSQSNAFLFNYHTTVEKFQTYSELLRKVKSFSCSKSIVGWHHMVTHSHRECKSC